MAHVAPGARRGRVRVLAPRAERGARARVRLRPDDQVGEQRGRRVRGEGRGGHFRKANAEGVGEEVGGKDGH